MLVQGHLPAYNRPRRERDEDPDTDTTTHSVNEPKRISVLRDSKPAGKHDGPSVIGKAGKSSSLFNSSWNIILLKVFE